MTPGKRSHQGPLISPAPLGYLPRRTWERQRQSPPRKCRRFRSPADPVLWGGIGRISGAAAVCAPTRGLRPARWMGPGRQLGQRAHRVPSHPAACPSVTAQHVCPLRGGSGAAAATPYPSGVSSLSGRSQADAYRTAGGHPPLPLGYRQSHGEGRASERTRTCVDLVASQEVICGIPSLGRDLRKVCCVPAGISQDGTDHYGGG